MANAELTLRRRNAVLNGEQSDMTVCANLQAEPHTGSRFLTRCVARLHNKTDIEITRLGKQLSDCGICGLTPELSRAADR